MPLDIGAQAPDFTLRTMSPDGLADVSLSDFKGKKNVVLLFFPGTFTPPCTQEMATCTRGQGVLPDENTAVLGISVDSPFSQAAWARQEGIPFPLLSDYARKVIRAYDVVVEDFLKTGGEAAARAVYVIDKQGVIRYAERTSTPPEQPNFAAVREVLDQL